MVSVPAEDPSLFFNSILVTLEFLVLLTVPILSPIPIPIFDTFAFR